MSDCQCVDNGAERGLCPYCEDGVRLHSRPTAHYMSMVYSECDVCAGTGLCAQCGASAFATIIEEVKGE